MFALSLRYTQALGMFVTLSWPTRLGYERYSIPDIDLDCIDLLG
jgi:hypothetical protein